MKLSKARRMSEALGSWLHFEACCFRAGLFSESSFKAAIGSVASSLQADHRAARVHADYELPAIQRVPDAERGIGGGRKRSVDFALIYDDGREAPSDPELLIEAKWAGSSHCSVSNIVADFVRLAMMKRAHPNAICLFILAGPFSDVSKVLSKPPFKNQQIKKDAIGFASNMRKFEFRPTSAEHQKHYGAALNAFLSANLSVPAGFTVTSTGCYPHRAPGQTAKFQAVAWEVYYVPRSNISAKEWPQPLKRTKRKLEHEEIA